MIKIHLLGVQDEDFELTLEEYANKLDSECLGIKDLKKKYDKEMLVALYEDFIMNEINDNNKYRIGDLIWVYPTYYTSRMYLGYNNIVFDKIKNIKVLEIDETKTYCKILI